MVRLASLLFVSAALVTAPALAQSGALDAPAEESSGGVRTVSSGTALDDDQATIEEDARRDDDHRSSGDDDEPEDDGVNPLERADHDYFFTGVFFRGVVIPDFIQGLFVHYEGGTPVNFGGGAYFGWRRNGFNVRAEVWYLGMGNAGFYRGMNAADTELESLHVDLGVVMGNFSFGWTFWINEYFGIDLSFGLGLGGVTGNMWRQEAYRDGAGRAHECSEPGDAADGRGYCEGNDTPAEDRHTNHDASGPTYQRFCDANPTAPECAGRPGAGNPTPFYFGDGGVPPLFFWIDLPRIGFTIKPIRQFEIRIDGGYNLYGFNFGAAMGVGF